MRNLLLMARHEYTRLARRRTFLLSTLGFPLLIAIALAIGFFFAQSQESAPLGYVDHAGFLNPVLQSEENDRPILAFASEDEAEAALAAGAIEAVYVFPADYLENPRVSMQYVDEPPGSSAQRDLRRFVRASLIVDLPEDVQQRIVEGVELTVQSADGSRSVGTGNVLGFLLPFAAAMLFVIATMTSAGYMLQVVAEEKENRTMEILVTTLRPIDLIGGKALGLMALALTQIAIWAAAVAVALVVGARFWEPLRNPTVPWQLLGIAALFFVPSFALVAGFMTAIGSAVTEVRQGQQVSGILNLFFVLPFFILPVLLNAPNGPLAIALTLFPTTAFVTVTMRWAIAFVPLWQLIVSFAILVIAAALSVWASSRIFRAGMLRYGQPLSVRGALATLGIGQ